MQFKNGMYVGALGQVGVLWLDRSTPKDLYFIEFINADGDVDCMLAKAWEITILKW
jgi:hypothetical protein